MNKKITSLFVGTFFVLAASLSMGVSGAFAAQTTVITNGSPSVTGTTATVSGTYSTTGAGGADTYINWGPTPSLGSHTVLVHNASASDTFTATITGLTPGVQYFYQAFASNPTTGPGYGSTLSFTTTGTATSSVITKIATSSIGGTSATLTGFFSGTISSPTETQFYWGLSVSNLTQSTGYVAQSGASGNFSATINSLTPNTTYYYRAAARTAGGTTYGTTLSFKTTGSTGADCTIDAFNASNTSVSSGTSVTLSWTTVGCTTGTINNGVGAATPIANGSISTGPLTATTTFTLTANSGSKYDNDTVTIIVNGGSQNSCSLTSFYASPATVAYGGSSTLYFNPSGCTNVSISPATGGAVTSGATYYNTGALYSSQTYTITASSGTGTPRTLSTTVTVDSNGGGTGSCSIDSFYASPGTVSYGSSATLYWNTSNCSNVSIDQGVSAYGLSSSAITPVLYASTTFNLTATDMYGYTNSRQLFVGVTSTGTTGGTTTYGTTGGYGYCTITSFTSTQSTVTNGQTTMITWTSTGCTTLSLSGGGLYTHMVPANGSETTGTLYGTTTFTLYGNGTTSATQSTTVYVTNSPYPYSYGCQGGSYDPSCAGQYAGTIITTPATNVGSTSARLNGLANNIVGTWAGYFEYGTTRNLGQATGFQHTFPVTSYYLYDTIRTLPSTTYYFRAAAQINGTIVRGDIYSFTTSATGATNIVYVEGSSSSTNSQSTIASSTNASGVLVTVKNQGDKVNVGDTVEYTITYTNNTNTKLSNSILTFTLPQGFSVKQTTQGMMQPPMMVTVNLGTIAPGQTGSIYVQANVEPNVATNQTLVSNATLAYTLPNGTHDSAVGYTLNHASVQNVFAGFALGSGFFPSTIWGWLLTFIIILIIVLISRRIARAKSAHDTHGHGDHGHGAGHGAAKH